MLMDVSERKRLFSAAGFIKNGSRRAAYVVSVCGLLCCAHRRPGCVTSVRDFRGGRGGSGLFAGVIPIIATSAEIFTTRG
jgi:hypothetical protein